MPKPLRILYVSAELAPLIKTGGLADVSNALPRALHAMGHDVRVVMPLFRGVPLEHRGEQRSVCVADLLWDVVHGAVRESRIPGSDVPLYFIEHNNYFDRDGPYGEGNTDYPDNLERFAFFSMALLDAMPRMQWNPDVLHCHDWHTALAPVFCKTRLLRHPLWGKMPTVFTIHNLAYQGSCPGHLLPRSGLGWDLFHPDGLEFHGNVNLMKGGILFSDKITTVSKRYAREIQTPEYGEGLDHFLLSRRDNLSGIVNGVDYTEWNPATDTHIAAHYTAKNLVGKVQCRSALRAKVGLPECDVPLIGMVSRIVEMKGFGIVVDALEELMKLDLQLLILGSGDPKLTVPLAEAALAYPDRISVQLAYDNELAHQIYAGADFLLMPSLVEPCGLSQLYALAYGTPPIVRRTGGLADTVRDATPAALAKGNATGFTFPAAKASSLVKAVQHAAAVYTDRTALDSLRRTAMAQDFSWDRSSRDYVKIYREAIRAKSKS